MMKSRLLKSALLDKDRAMRATTQIRVSPLTIYKSQVRFIKLTMRFINLTWAQTLASLGPSLTDEATSQSDFLYYLR